MNDPDDVSRDKDGTWHIKAGAMVRVRVTMVADSNHTNMALVDPLPAGLEASTRSSRHRRARRPTSTCSRRVRERTSLPMWFGATWSDHENMRDDRVEAFASYLYGGTYVYTYVARATTPGEFVVPPAKAEEIYAPEVSAARRAIASTSADLRGG